MSSIETAIKYLKERNIDVSYEGKVTLFCKKDNLSLQIQNHGDGFYLKRWECTPGPGEGDFIVAYKSIDEVLLAVWCFYYAKPLDIDGWTIPIHLRPFWSLNKLQFRLSNCICITSGQFETIVHTRRERELRNPKNSLETGHDRLAVAERTQFLSCFHKINSNIVLELRRDLEEGYFVKCE